MEKIVSRIAKSVILAIFVTINRARFKKIPSSTVISQPRCLDAFLIFLALRMEAYSKSERLSEKDAHLINLRLWRAYLVVIIRGFKVIFCTPD